MKRDADANDQNGDPSDLAMWQYPEYECPSSLGQMNRLGLLGEVHCKSSARLEQRERVDLLEKAVQVCILGIRRVLAAIER